MTGSKKAEFISNFMHWCSGAPLLLGGRWSQSQNAQTKKEKGEQHQKVILHITKERLQTYNGRALETKDNLTWTKKPDDKDTWEKGFCFILVAASIATLHCDDCTGRSGD